MSVIEDEIFKFSLEFIVSRLVLEEVSEVGVFDSFLVVVGKRLPGF